MPQETDPHNTDEPKPGMPNDLSDEEWELWLLFEAWKIGYVKEIPPSP